MQGLGFLSKAVSSVSAAATEVAIEVKTGVSGATFRVSRLVCRVSGLWFRVYGVGFRQVCARLVVQRVGFRRWVLDE